MKLSNSDVTVDLGDDLPGDERHCLLLIIINSMLEVVATGNFIKNIYWSLCKYMHEFKHACMHAYMHAYMYVRMYL